MGGAPETAVEKLTACQPRQRRQSAQQLHYNRLSRAILNTTKSLNQLARLGRPGQWVLHHEDLYEAGLDTRPQSRNPDKEVPVRGLTCYGAPVRDYGLIWAGKGPAPDFSDVGFWEDTLAELKAKIEQVKKRRVRPHFTPEELQALESLENQTNHFFHTERNFRTTRKAENQGAVFYVLFSLARLGRPGQWVLHNEALYHPAIDTRLQTRVGEEHIVIRDSTYIGDARVMGDGLLVDFELTWAGKRPHPDFTDFDYWEDKLTDLRDKRRQIEEGRLEYRFTANELRTLEALENDKDHAFAKFLKERDEQPAAAGQTPEDVSTSRKLASAMQMVVDVMGFLWYAGLAGKWVLHCEGLYLPEYDTRFRENTDEGSKHIVHDIILFGSDSGLHFDTRLGPLPDFNDIGFWQDKRAELAKKDNEVAAGLLTTHNFTKGELMRIELLERDILDRREHDFDRGRSGVITERKARMVEEWLGVDTGRTKLGLL